MPKKIAILEINGGIGKSIMASAVCEAIKKAHPDRFLVVFTAWVEPLLNNPYVDRVYKTGITQYIYNDLIKDNDVLFLCEEPYRSQGFLSESKHLIESWCEAIKIPYNGENPKLYLTPIEQIYIANSFVSQKPILVIHPFGGANKKYSYSWNRDMPFNQAQELCNILSEKYRIIQLGYQDQPRLNNVEFANLAIRETFCLLKTSSARILIDSYSQHACAAMDLPSVVCWITNKPRVFGYNIHKNIEANWDNANLKIHNIDGYLSNWDFTGGRMYDYPFKSENVFRMGEILESLTVLQRK